MKKLYALLLLFTSGLWAQDFEWLQTPPITLSSNPDLVGYVTAADESGGVYFVGYKENPVNYNETLGDLFYNKYNDAGELQFSNTFVGKGSVYDISIDQWGNVILALGYLNTITIGTQTFEDPVSGIKPLVLKFDNHGELLWHYKPTINGEPASYFRALTTDSFGNIYIGYDNFNSSFVEKLTPNGASSQLIAMTHVSLLSSVAVDTEGNIYAAGSCVDPGSTFAGVAVSTALFYNTYIVKFSAEGAYQWVRFVDDITCPKPQVAVNTPDEVYFTSSLFENYEFDGIATEGPMSGMFSDFFLTKLNAQGTFQWVREIPGTGVFNFGKRHCLTADGSGNVYLAGSFRWTINWGNNITTATPTFSSDALLLKYNNSGDLLFAKTGGGNSEDRFDSVVVNNMGDLYLSGMGRGSGTFGTVGYEGEGVASYAFLTKITNSTLATTQQQSIHNNLKIYPNPAGDSFHIGKISETISGKIYNTLGQEVQQFETNQHAPVAIGNLAKGIYLVKANNQSMKLIKE